MKKVFRQKKSILMLLSIMLMLAMLSGCQQEKVDSLQDDSIFIAGTYTGEANGIGGTIVVEVTFEENEIKEYAIESDCAQFTCTCPFAKNSHRKRIRKEIESLTQSKSSLKQNIFESMKNIKIDYLL